MTSPPDSEPLSSSLPTLLIDWRLGSVEMHLGLEKWQGQLPMTAADCSQINTARGVCQLAVKPAFVLSPDSEGS